MIYFSLFFIFTAWGFFFCWSVLDLDEQIEVRRVNWDVVSL
jgi:hypothetical protein